MKKYNEVSFKYIKKYFSRSVAIAVSIILSTILIVGIGTLSKSAKQAEVDIVKYDTGNSHVRLSGINEEQLKTLKSNSDVKNIAATSLYDSYNYKNKVLMNIVCADKNYINLDNGSLKKGSFPQNSNEIALEEWVLKNLNIDPVVGSKIQMKLDSSKTKTFKLVGILNDIPSKKTSGMAEAIIGFDTSVKKDNMMAFVEFNEDADMLSCISNIQGTLKLTDKNMSVNTMLLDALNKYGGIDWNIISISIIVSVVACIVIYGVFNISIYQRMGEYGILRAIGCKRYQIFNIIFSELFVISIISLPIGMIVGVFGAKLLSSKFGQLFTEFDVSNMKISMSSEILILNIVLILLIITLISLKTSREVFKVSPIEAIKRINKQNKKVRKNIVPISLISKIVSYHRAISIKNITENKKSFFMIILSMSIGSVLFIGSSYYSNIQRQLSTQKQQETKIDYDYKIVTNGTLSMNDGLSKEDVEKIKDIKGIKDLNPTKITYARNIINKKDIKEPDHFKYLEKRNSDWKINVKESDDKKSLILQSGIWGYSDQALNELNKFLVAGKIDIDKMKEDNSVIAYVPTLANSGSKEVIDVKPGDVIDVSFRKDGKVSEEFYGMKDKGEYIKKQFKVAGIITTLPVWDDFYCGQDETAVILPEENFDKVCGFNNYRVLHANKSSNSNSEEVYQEILNITNKTEGVSVRDLSKERVEVQDYYKTKDSYIYIISIVLFLISMLNITNNISYRLMSRTNEFGMLRAIGLDNKEFKQMIRFEGLSFGIISGLISIILSFIVQCIMFKYFSVSLKNPTFDIQWMNYILIILVNMLIGVGAAYIPLRKINKLSIIESITSIE